MTTNSEWFKAKVITGNRIGRTIGMPTINLNNPAALKGCKEGVYLSEVLVNNHSYYGALYYGPRTILGETQNILEINLLNFEGNLYGEEVEVKLLDFVRPPKSFKSLEEMKQTLEEDNKNIASLLGK